MRQTKIERFAYVKRGNLYYIFSRLLFLIDW
jgi:hypothetical protein